MAHSRALHTISINRQTSTFRTRLAMAQMPIGTSLCAAWLTLVTMQDDNEHGSDEDHDAGVATATAKPVLKRPPMYKVILLNDDYTPMEFVVHILEKFFSMNREKATQIMLTVHTQGAAAVGIFPRDIAESKSEQINLYAQENNHPLMSTIEMTDTE